MRALSNRMVLLSWFLFAIVTHAETQVPSTLEPWRGWVVQGQEFRACPLIAGKGGESAEDFLCAWPGVLVLSADEHGVSFARARARAQPPSARP